MREKVTAAVGVLEGAAIVALVGTVWWQRRRLLDVWQAGFEEGRSRC